MPKLSRKSMEYKIGDRVGTEYYVCNTLVHGGKILNYPKNDIDVKIQEKIITQEDLDSLKKGYIAFQSLDDSRNMTCIEKSQIFKLSK